MIKIYEGYLSILHKYCMKTPATPEIIIERVLREWYSRKLKLKTKEELTTADMWELFGNLKPNIPKIPEKYLTGVDIDKKIEKNFIKIAEKLNLNPDDLATWLVYIFLKAFDIEKKIEIQKKRKTENY